MAKKEKLDLKTPDAFHTTSDKMFVWIEEHAKTVLSVVAGLVALSLVYIGYTALAHRREASAVEAIFAPESALKKAEARVREAREKDATHVPTAAEKKQPPKPVKGFEEEFAPLVSALEAKIKEYGSTRVGLVAAMNLAYFLITEKKAERALSVLESATYHPRASDLLAGFYEMHRGLALIETGKYKDAGDAYQAVVGQKNLNALHPEAALKLGLAKELGGDSEAAREAYEKVGRDYPGTEAATTAQNFLRALSLKAKKG